MYHFKRRVGMNIHAVNKSTFAVAFLVIVCPAMLFPQSIAEKLSDYKKISQVTIEGITGVSSPCVSGITLHPGTGTLFVINDIADYIFEITTDGELIRSIKLSGFNDLEGIAYQSDSTFFIVEERDAEVVRMVLPTSGGGPVEKNKCTVFSVGETMGNTGLEDVAYCTSANTVYAVKEKLPIGFFRIALDENGNPVESFENDPFSIDDIDGDAAGLYALEDGNFLILNQEGNTLYGYSSTGERLSELAVEMRQPEGVTVDPVTKRIYMAGEPNELAVFECEGITERSHLPSIRQNTFHFQMACNRTAVCNVTLSLAGNVHVELISLQGRRMATLVDEKKEAGVYRMVLSMRSVPAGVYGIVLRTGAYRAHYSVVLN